MLQKYLSLIIKYKKEFIIITIILSLWHTWDSTIYPQWEDLKASRENAQNEENKLRSLRTIGSNQKELENKVKEQEFIYQKLLSRFPIGSMSGKILTEIVQISQSSGLFISNISPQFHLGQLESEPSITQHAITFSFKGNLEQLTLLFEGLLKMKRLIHIQKFTLNIEKENARQPSQNLWTPLKGEITLQTYSRELPSQESNLAKNAELNNLAVLLQNYETPELPVMIPSFLRKVDLFKPLRNENKTQINKTFFEQFSASHITVKGIIMAKKRLAIVQFPDGFIDAVSEGQKLGSEGGFISQIYSTHVDLRIPIFQNESKIPIRYEVFHMPLISPQELNEQNKKKEENFLKDMEKSPYIENVSQKP